MNVVQGSRSSYGDDMAAFLCFMAVRLLAMHRVLKSTGSIYLHCDPTASHYLKGLMDAIFGRRNFRNEVIWKRTSSHNRAKRWGPIHGILLFYSKGRKLTWNRVLQPLESDYVESFYRYTDDRGRYGVDNLLGPGPRTGDTGMPWRGTDPMEKGRHWEVPPDRAMPDWFVFPENYAELSARKRLDLLDEQGLIYWPRKEGGVPRYKRYFGSHSGSPVQDMILDIKPLSKGSTERIGYPTQKPLALYERIIKTTSNSGDMVLDPFAGCATTCVAAQRLGRQWVGIDIWDKAHETVIDDCRRKVSLGRTEA